MSELAFEAQIRQALAAATSLGEQARTIPADANLYRLGLSSHASVNLMLRLEDDLGLEFPDHLMQKDVFSTIASIDAAIHEATGGTDEDLTG